MRTLLLVFAGIGAGAVVPAVAHAGDRIPVRSCAQRAESLAPNPVYNRGPHDVFVGRRLLLLGANGTGNGPVIDEGPPPTLWHKTLAVVRAGRSVTLSVPRRMRRRLGLRYRQSGREQTPGFGDPAVRFVACRDRTWTYFPGGFLFRAPGCFAVDVRIEGRRASRHRIALGRGAKCPG